MATLIQFLPPHQEQPASFAVVCSVAFPSIKLRGFWSCKVRCQTTRHSAAQIRHRRISLKGFFIVFNKLQDDEARLVPLLIWEKQLWEQPGREFPAANTLQKDFAKQESMLATQPWVH